MNYYEKQLNKIKKENILDIELFLDLPEQNLYTARIKLKSTNPKFTYEYITLTTRDELQIAINLLQDSLKHIKSFDRNFIRIENFDKNTGSIHPNILYKIITPRQFLKELKKDLYKDETNNDYFIKKNNSFEKLEQYQGQIITNENDLSNLDKPILKKVDKKGLILSFDNSFYYFKSDDNKIYDLNNDENIIEVKMEKQKVNNIKFAGDLKNFISELFDGIDIEKTKDDSSVEIINKNDIKVIGDRNSGEQQPFVRGSLIAFGQFVRTQLKNYLFEKLELNKNEVLEWKDLRKVLKSFIIENHPKRIFDSKDMFNHFTGIDVIFNKDTILKMKISETGKIKEFKGSNLFDKVDQLFYKFIENNIDIILYSQDIWTEIALRNRKDNEINIISDARFLTECQISSSKFQDAFFTIILPLQQDNQLQLKNFEEIFELYRNCDDINTFINFVSKPNIINPYLIGNDEINKFLDDNNLEYKRNSVYSTKIREDIYNQFFNSKLNKDRQIFDPQTEKLLTSKLVNEAEELSTLLVLHNYLKKNRFYAFNFNLDEDIKKHGLDKNVLIIDSKRGDFLSLINSSKDIFQKIKNSHSQLTLLSTISGGGKDTITSILENVNLQKIPYDENINQTYIKLIELLNDDNIKNIVKKDFTYSKDEIMDEIIKLLPKEEQINGNFLNKIDTLNIYFINTIGRVLKEVEMEKKKEIEGIVL